MTDAYHTREQYSHDRVAAKAAGTGLLHVLHCCEALANRVRECRCVSLLTCTIGQLASWARLSLPGKSIGPLHALWTEVTVCACLASHCIFLDPGIQTEGFKPDRLKQ